MNRLFQLTALLCIALLTACSQMTEEEVVIVEPIVAEPAYEGPGAKGSVDEACTSGDGIGGTGCPAID